MSVPEVQEVIVEPDTDAGLAGAELLHPREGVAASALLVRGWVLGAESRALAVELAQGDRVVRVAPVREPSPDLAAAYPDRPEAAHSEFITRLHTPVLDTRRPLVVRAVLAGGLRAGIATIRLAPRSPRSTTPRRGAQRERPSLKPRIEQLAIQIAGPPDADRDRAFAGPGLLGAPGDAAADPRMRALGGVDVRGRRVLDVGSRAGHLARTARARGAVLVDGIEQDGRLLVLSRLLNAYHGTTRVSFSAVLDDLDGAYDVVLAPAHGDAAPDADAIARVTDGVLIAGADTSLEELRAAFPHQRVLEVAGTEVIACAHRPNALPG